MSSCPTTRPAFFLCLPPSVPCICHSDPPLPPNQRPPSSFHMYHSRNALCQHERLLSKGKKGVKKKRGGFFFLISLYSSSLLLHSSSWRKKGCHKKDATGIYIIHGRHRKVWTRPSWVVKGHVCLPLSSYTSSQFLD